MPLQGIAPENNRHLFEGLDNYMQNKNEGNENKIILGNVNCIMDKIDRDGENKTQKLYRCFSNFSQSKFFVDNEVEDIYGEERIQIPLSSPATIGPLARIQERQGLY